jgi:hypothetical protein
MELSEHIVDFEKRSVIKSQVLTDFIANLEGMHYKRRHSRKISSSHPEDGELI